MPRTEIGEWNTFDSLNLVKSIQKVQIKMDQINQSTKMANITFLLNF